MFCAFFSSLCKIRYNTRMNTEITYFLVRFDSVNSKEDFEKMVSTLSTIPGVTATPVGDNEIAITYKDNQQYTHVRFRLNPSPTSLGQGHQSSMMMTCQKADRTTVELFRKLAQNFQYRLYSISLHCFLPRYLDLLDMDQVILTEKGE